MPPCQGSKFKSHCSGLKIAINNIFRFKNVAAAFVVGFKEYIGIFFGSSENIEKYGTAGKRKTNLSGGYLVCRTSLQRSLLGRPIPSEWIIISFVFFFRWRFPFSAFSETKMFRTKKLKLICLCLSVDPSETQDVKKPKQLLEVCSGGAKSYGFESPAWRFGWWNFYQWHGW